MKFNENRLKGSGDMERTQNSRVNPLTLTGFVLKGKQNSRTFPGLFQDFFHFSRTQFLPNFV